MRQKSETPKMIAGQINTKLFWKLWWLKTILSFYIKNNYLNIDFEFEHSQMSGQTSFNLLMKY